MIFFPLPSHYRPVTVFKSSWPNVTLRPTSWPHRPIPSHTVPYRLIPSHTVIHLHSLLITVFNRDRDKFQKPILKYPRKEQERIRHQANNIKLNYSKSFIFHSRPWPYRLRYLSLRSFFLLLSIFACYYKNFYSQLQSSTLIIN